MSPGLMLSPVVSTSNVSQDRQSTPEHLADVDDGCGCVEVWEHTSDQREEDSAGEDDAEDSPSENDLDGDDAENPSDGDA